MTLASLLEPFIGPVSWATAAFPAAAAFIVVPFALYHYRRHGRVHPWRAFVTYGFVYYLIAALFLVILPLPQRPVGALETAAWKTRYAEIAHPRLDPTGFVRDLRVAQPGPPRAKAAAQIVFNVLLLVPFGAHLAYAFGRPLAAVPLYGLSLSLFFEVCQLTGIFGLYPGPYRLFDAGDLVLNTAGSFAGALLARGAVRLRILPALSRLRGPADPWIRPFRRLLGLFLDLCALGATALAAVTVLDLVVRPSPARDAARAVSVTALALLWLVLLPALDRGRGLGKRLTMCAIRRPGGGRAGAARVLARQALIWAAPAAGYAAATLLPGRGAGSVPVLALVGVWGVFWILNALKATFDREHAGYADLWLDTRVRDTWSESAAARATARRPRRLPRRARGRPSRRRPRP